MLLLPAILSGCQTTTDFAETDFCSAARAIYWSKYDTKFTIEQVKEHNAVGMALKCGWTGIKRSKS